MAHDTVSAVIESLPSRKELMVHSPRTAAVRQCVKDVLEACSKEGNKERFARFSLELLTLLKSTLESSKPTALSQRRERLWITFCKLRAERLPTLWKEFLQDICCNSSIKEPLFTEIVNETLLEDMYAIPQREEGMPTSTKNTYLTKDEENIIRYACGYVGMKLVYLSELKLVA